MICFVILHYMVIDETIGCISSIKDKIKSTKKIIVVDNKSPNNSGEELAELYKSDDEVVILLNNCNDGFAKGNNHGFRYAKDLYSPDFIVVMNNDVEIMQHDFESRLYSEYKRHEFDILGPDIYSTTYKIHQSPKRANSYSYEEVVRLNKKYKSQLSNSIFVNIKCILKKITPLRMFVYKKRRKDSDYTKPLTNVILHGACVIYSKKYISRYSFAFLEGTFFYYEMEILDYFCKRNGLLTIYSPDLKVAHHQNVSTNVAYKSMKEKTFFANKCNYESTLFFIKFMEENPISDNVR